MDFKGILHTVESTYFFCVNVYLSAIFTLCQSRILGGKTDKTRLNTFPINTFFNYPGQQEICINDIYIYINTWYTGYDHYSNSNNSM